MWLENLNKMKTLSKKTLEQISKESGIKRGTLNKIFAGQTKDPQLSTIQTIVHSLGYTLDDLTSDNIEKKPNNFTSLEDEELKNLVEVYSKLPEISRKKFINFLETIVEEEQK